MACNLAVKLLMPLENRTFSLLDEEATKRGVSVQELLRAVIVPDWLRMRSHVVNGEAPSNYRRTLAYKLTSLEKAFQDLKSEIERGALVVQREDALVRPIKLIRSIEALLIRTFGGIAASSLLYEIGKEAGKHSVGKGEKEFSRASSIHRFQQACRTCSSFAPLWGWERLETKEFHFEKKIIVSRGEGSIYVRNKTGRIPVCHFGRGALAGTLQAILRVDCESIEIACEGKGDGFCEVITGASGEIAHLAEGLDGLATARL